ncbi:hypothetical protein PISL3812_02961 [Talaromyces islandicus]|uniref:N-acetyltransferase domain-containing protein n=1 Tax=Talaromyces islandicus TaxID=28573 RepID=A0A0U1LRD2_TALIS|nr:hypothetical protein PISL3812_02961 [Talaromyces islandicus]
MAQGPFYYEQRRLENDLVALEIFDPSVHAAQFVEALPHLSTYLILPTIKSEADFMNELYNKYIQSMPDTCLYAIINKVTAQEETEIETGKGKGKGQYAGVISLNATNPTNAVTEIGVMIFPAWQRTHVATNAIGLLLQYTLDPPSAGGLGLRRVEWKCHAGNEASRKTAARMGFELEGILRWDRVFPGGAVVLPVDALEKRNGTTGEVPGRHTAIYSIVWDEWEEKRPQVVAQMERFTR